MPRQRSTAVRDGEWVVRGRVIRWIDPCLAEEEPPARRRRPPWRQLFWVPTLPTSPQRRRPTSVLSARPR